MTDYYVDEEFEGGPDGPNGPADDPGYYYADDPVSPPGRSGVTQISFDEIEGRTTWIYLGLLTFLFLVLVVISRACAPDPTTPTDLLPVGGDSPAEIGEIAVRLAVEVDGDVVRLIGAVPDDGARQQVLSAAASLYGQENVIDELTVDPRTTVEDGVLSLTGSVVFGDERPAQLRDAVTSGLGLTVGEFAVVEGEAVVEVVELRAELAGGAVRFSGVIPDDGSAGVLVAAGESVWGPGSVDMSGVTVGDVTWTEATVALTGVTGPGDQRYTNLPAEIQSRFGNLVTVDITGVTVDTGPEAVAAVQAAIAEAVTAQPITFAAGSAEIDSTSDGVLATIAEQLGLLPDLTVEIVGHTDNRGTEESNLAVSQLRAEAVVSRLVELGLDGARFTARGAGSSDPIADNGTAGGRAQNRRIEFILG